MTQYPITNWDDAYDNATYIEGGAAYIQKWNDAAAIFRQKMLSMAKAEIDLTYDHQQRNKLDIFHPEGKPKGLMLFIHGGYWKAFDKSTWSHLATGALSHGYAVAIPSYTLCPDARLSQITKEIGNAISFCADKISGNIHLSGHSAGGHLVTRMICTDSPLSPKILPRIQKVVSISGVHDLRPLLNTQLNNILNIDENEAIKESPLLNSPIAGKRLCCYVGADERPEFIRQSHIQAEIWRSFEVRTSFIDEPRKHHFNIINGLLDPSHALTVELLSQ